MPKPKFDINDARRRRAEIARELRELLNTVQREERAFTPEETTRFETLEGEARQLAEQIEREERVTALEGQTRGIEGGRPDPSGGRQDRQADPYGGRYERAADFLSDFVRTRQDSCPREVRDMMTSVGSAGGLLIPHIQQEGVSVMATPESAIVRPRALVIPAGDVPDAAYSIIVMRQGATGVYGGLVFEPVAEGGAKPGSKDIALDEIKLEPQERAGYTALTDKQLRNAPATGTFLVQQFQKAKAGQEDYLFLRGSGVNQPLGVVNGPSTLQVARAAAGAIGFADVVNMLTRLNPESWGSAIFTASVTCLPQIASMQDSAGNSIFIAGDVTKKVPMTLLGIPLRMTGRMPVLGQTGDLGLFDFGNYLIKDGSGPYVAWSEHVWFLNNKTAVKFFWYVDGQPGWKEPLLLEDSVTTVSPFVVLG